MKDINKIISGLSSSGLISGLAGGALGGALMSKKGRKVGKSALKYGALAAVGGLAWKAYQAYSQRNAQQQASPVSAQQPTQAAVAQSQFIRSEPREQLTYSPASLQQQQFEQVVEDERDNGGQMLILRAMIAAANADGHIDEDERARIYAQVDQLTLTTEDKAGLFDELRQPLDLSQLVAQVPNSETAVEVYAASVLAIDQNAQASQSYLNRLATSLMIPKELVSAIHTQAGEYQ